jgi:uncharacterized integral membrane protein
MPTMKGATMNVRSLLLTLVLVLVAAFAVLNWAAFTAPTMLTLGFTQVEAPLGLIMLIALGVISVLFLAYIVFQQAGVIVEARRYAKELKAQRELADTAEASRFTELRTYLEGELRRIEAQAAAGTREVTARIERLETQLHERLAESTRTLTAYVGEVEDKIDRAIAPPQA